MSGRDESLSEMKIPSIAEVVKKCSCLCSVVGHGHHTTKSAAWRVVENLVLHGGSLVIATAAGSLLFEAARAVVAQQLHIVQLLAWYDDGFIPSALEAALSPSFSTAASFV